LISVRARDREPGLQAAALEPADFFGTTLSTSALEADTNTNWRRRRRRNKRRILDR
jgi:hypothetical protein